MTATVTGIDVTSGPLSGGTVVTITGTDLAGALTVQFGGAAVNVPEGAATATQVKVTTPATSTGGTVEVRVNLPTGLTPINPAVTFTYAQPSVTGMTPTSGSAGTHVTITGVNLSGALTVLFGGIGVNVPASATAAEIVVPAPVPQQATGPVDVKVNLTSGEIDAGSFDYVKAVPVNALFVMRNQTGVPDDLVFVKFLGAQINASSVAQTYGNGQALATGADTFSRSYSLADMTTPIPGGQGAPAPQFAINDYSGGRIYFSLGVPLVTTTTPAAHNPTDADFHTVYCFVEPSVFPNVTKGNTNLDGSYVDFIGIPVDIAIRRRVDDSLVVPPDNNPQQTPAGTVVFDKLTADSNIPAATVVTAGTSATAGGQTVAIAGTARLLSPSTYIPSLIPNAQPYHDWTGPGSLIAALTASGAKMPVASYTTVDSGVSVPKGTLFGFSGCATSKIAPGWAERQDYDTQAVALADLNPGGANMRIPTLAGVAGIKISGTGTVVGPFDIYLTNADLDKPIGVYGANPPYVIDCPPTAPYTTTGIENDLSGRIVGDLLAGFNFGWAGCETTVAERAQKNGLASSLAGTVFDVNSGSLANKAIAELTTGQLFYLLSLQKTTQDLAQWFGAAIQPHNPNYYNNYSSDFQALTTCYNMAFTDRLQGPSDPDIFFPPSDQTYVEVTLLPGAYKVTVTS